MSGMYFVVAYLSLEEAHQKWCGIMKIVSKKRFWSFAAQSSGNDPKRVPGNRTQVQYFLSMRLNHAMKN
jgi:hypothetical protein